MAKVITITHLAVGFDPSFIDEIVRLEDNNGNLIPSFPKPGHHHRNTVIHRIAGGNGVNVAFTLQQLGYNIEVVVPANDEYLILLAQRGLTSVYQLGTQINQTIAVTWAEGEVQMNSINGKLGKEHWSEVVHEKWQANPLNISINWGLNPSSMEWISLQWIASCNVKYEDILWSDPVTQALEVHHCKIPLIIEPGLFSQHPDSDQLQLLLKHMMGSGNCILLGNEEERSQYISISENKIIHTASSVEISKKGTKNVKIPKLEQEPVTFVGAGDAFLSGIVHGILLNIRDLEKLVNFGISTAQKYIQGIL
ncbi:MAG: hypothetical protein INQ03_08515 [Candidatus Heimdallarchaeota archaeon]|nr:hypothetical protein [Candidatus Heimdallarchaeota archaeon]